MKWLYWILVVELVISTLAIAQELTERPVQFITSQVESLQLDKLRLEGEVLSLRKQLAETQLTCGTAHLKQELSQYTIDTLKAHGNPDGVTFDPSTMSWKVKP
jgi:hypothetical protein